MSENGKRIYRKLQQKIRPGKKGVTIEHPLLGYDFVHFLHHAQLRMKQRGVSQSEVFRVLESPGKRNLKTEPNRERWRKYRRRRQAVDVVFERWPTKICIVNVMVIDT